MGYKECLELAGAKVLSFESFGSYQGDWLAKVEYQDRVGWVRGYFGSCSGCDSFEGEFGFDDHDHYNLEKGYNESISYYDLFRGRVPEEKQCNECKQLLKRLAEFGEGYLDNILTQEQVEEFASRNLEWDSDAREMLDYVKQNSIGYLN